MLGTNTARAFWIQEPGRGEIIDEELPPRPRDHVRVRTLFSGVSRGTESLVFRGRVPRSQWDAMRAPFQAGSFPAPVKYGYACVGVVEEGPDPDHGASLAGRTVFCLHPHQDHFQLPAAAVRPLPPGVPPGRAVLAANLETAINACWDGAPRVGDRVAVVGGGVVGLLTAWLCRQVPGTRVTVVDPEPTREETCRALGLSWRPDPPADPGSDLAIHASGTPEGLAGALAAAGTESTVLELSWYGDRAVPAPLGEAFHHRRLTLRSSQVGSLPPERTPRWTHTRRLDLALELLEDPALDALVSGESDFEELPEVMARLSEPSARALCHRIRYRPAGTV